MARGGFFAGLKQTARVAAREPAPILKKDVAKARGGAPDEEP